MILSSPFEKPILWRLSSIDQRSSTASPRQYNRIDRSYDRNLASCGIVDASPHPQRSLRTVSPKCWRITCWLRPPLGMGSRGSLVKGSQVQCMTWGVNVIQGSPRTMSYDGSFTINIIRVASTDVCQVLRLDLALTTLNQVLTPTPEPNKALMSKSDHCHYIICFRFGASKECIDGSTFATLSYNFHLN